ncbi:MAG: HAD-IA family hydrolase [Planctomycetota bacterium]|nr:HAD-IA family hydrolase [Planctomycetota bacterium]
MNLALPVQPVVLFDAVGTLIFPSRPVAEYYAQVGKNHGLHVSADALQSRFEVAFCAQFEPASTHYHHPCSDLGDNQKWRQVVKSVFQSDFTESLFDDLWNLFAKPTTWKLDPRTIPIIDQLHQLGIIVGVASNFDSRLNPIIQELIPQIPADHIFCSTRIGYSKPDIRFYKSIEKAFEQPMGKRQFLMIGDHWANDVEAALRSGWNALWKPDHHFPSLAKISDHFFRKTKTTSSDVPSI